MIFGSQNLDEQFSVRSTFTNIDIDISCLPLSSENLKKKTVSMSVQKRLLFFLKFSQRNVNECEMDHLILTLNLLTVLKIDTNA